MGLGLSDDDETVIGTSLTQVMDMSAIRTFSTSLRGDFEYQDTRPIPSDGVVPTPLRRKARFHLYHQSALRCGPYESDSWPQS